MNKLPKILENHINTIDEIGYVLELGFGYPVNLIELHHTARPYKCIGIEKKEIDSGISTSNIIDDLFEATHLTKRQICSLIQDSDSQREIYNAYKLYCALVLEIDPEDFDCFPTSLILHYNTDLKFYFENLEQNYLGGYDLIIASKVLSHIDPLKGTNKLDTIKLLLSKLTDNGSIYLKLNSDDFSTSNHLVDEGIKDPFTDSDLENIKSILNIEGEILTVLQGEKKVYELIGKRKF